MRLALLLALVLASACLRFGYEERRTPRAPKEDAGVSDAGTVRMDATVEDAAGPADSGRPDAIMDDSAAPDARVDDASIDDAGGDAMVVADAAPPEDDGGSEDASAGTDLCPEHSDAVFCDAFEGATLSSNAYKVITNGTVTRTDARAHTGSGSLHATTTSSSTRHPEARFGVSAFDNQMAGDIWLRAYYFVPSTVTVNRGFSTAVIAESEPPYFGFSLMVRPTVVQIAVGDTMHEGTTAFPRDAWTCVELHVKIDAAAGYFEAYLDGALAVRSPATDTLPDMGYTSADVGIHYADLNQAPVEVFVDDVLAGPVRVGCE